MLSLSDLTRIATALGGVPIPGCVEGSPAQRAGLRYGDVMLALDGVPTSSWTDFFQVRRSEQPRVRVFRHGTEFEVKLPLSVKTRCPREVLGTALGS